MSNKQIITINENYYYDKYNCNFPNISAIWNGP